MAPGGKPILYVALPGGGAGPPIVEELRKWLDDVAASVLPKSLFGLAVNYGRNQWTKLVRFLEDGQIEIRNNAAERSIRPFVIGRRNFLFCNTPKGARASAVIYSIIESAKENRLSMLISV